MTARAVQVGAQGVIVDGRIRDLAEIEEMGLPVWAKGKSTMGASPFCKLTKVAEPVTLCQDTICPVIVKTNDIILADGEGVVRIPQNLVHEVVKHCKVRTEIDAKCMSDLKKGSSIVETFKKHR